jgi:hypothetical protein
MEAVARPGASASAEALKGLSEGGRSGGGGIQQKSVETKGPAWAAHTQRHGSSVRWRSQKRHRKTHAKKRGERTPREHSYTGSLALGGPGASVFMGTTRYSRTKWACRQNRLQAYFVLE